MNPKLKTLGELFLGPHPHGVEDCGNCGWIDDGDGPICYNVAGENNGHATEITNGWFCENWKYFGLRYIEKLEKKFQK